jgi:uncharacterized protein YcbK (DUF882 family)|tara:strand:+ start:647 stop:1057 length:411 start_codon:yes stop_codon:yes gene_type:complete
MITSADQWDAERWPNFSFDEFKCKSSGEVSISPVALDFLQAFRNMLGKGVSINSGYRCPEHNNSVSSTGLDGPHTTGFAIDISTNGQTQYQLLKFAMSYNPQPLGIGIAKTFTHIDFCNADMNDKFTVRPNVWRYA